MVARIALAHTRVHRELDAVCAGDLARRAHPAPRALGAVCGAIHVGFADTTIVAVCRAVWNVAARTAPARFTVALKRGIVASAMSRAVKGLPDSDHHREAIDKVNQRVRPGASRLRAERTLEALGKVANTLPVAALSVA